MCGLEKLIGILVALAHNIKSSVSQWNDWLNDDRFLTDETKYFFTQYIIKLWQLMS